MDLLFQKYASPFSFVNEAIKTRQFCNFINKFVKTTNEEKEEEKLWEFWLHKVSGKSFNDFKEELKTDMQNAGMTKEEMKSIVENSLDILKTFKPTQQGGEE